MGVSLVDTQQQQQHAQASNAVPTERENGRTEKRKGKMDAALVAPPPQSSGTPCTQRHAASRGDGDGDGGGWSM